MANATADSQSSQTVITAPEVSPSLDTATLLGITGAFTVIALAMYLGGSPDSFIDIPAILIVGFGTLLVTSISFSMDELFRARKTIWRAIVYHSEQPTNAALQILYLAEVSRKKGKMALQKVMEAFGDNPFLHNGVALVLDGLATDEVESFLSREIQATRDRHLRSAAILRRAAEVAPAMGLIGTLVGLVQMLGNLEDPASIGPSMAVALLTTFYGAILANMVFTPLANKLERNSQAEVQVNQIYAIGVASISRQENPRRLEMLINTTLSPEQRVTYFN
ncbi:MAG: MotA/TolQ/ExbB proton channel family protein [Pseudomonadota bacterium]